MKAKDTILFEGVKLSHPDRPLPMANISKLTLAEYYQQISDWILPYIINRPLLILRCPAEANQKCFFQKHYRNSFPSEIYRINVEEKSEKSSPTRLAEAVEDHEFLMIKNLKGLLSLIQFNVLEIHPWGSSAKHLEKPDRIIFDLDPDLSISWKKLVQTAYLIKEELEFLGLKSYVKTTGGKGLHIVIPIKPKFSWEIIKTFTRHFAFTMTQKYPELFIATMVKKARRGKIFIDYLRNGRGSTSVAAFSTRAHALAPVSMPLSWEELAKTKSSQEFNVKNATKRMLLLKKSRKDPWKGFYQSPQNITQKMLKSLQIEDK